MSESKDIINGQNPDEKDLKKEAKAEEKAEKKAAGDAAGRIEELQKALEEAVKAMAKYQLGKNLSDKEVISIVSFMRTLTGENPYLTAT